MSLRLVLFFSLSWVGLLNHAAAQSLSLQANSGRDCATCHLSWTDSFQRKGAVVLMETPEHGVVSESETCLGCHDGSVADSRRRVWLDHGHQTGITPPPEMKVPDYLPLDNGKLACRTCHTAHGETIGEKGETLANTVFLRVRNDAGQLCMSCHADHTKGPELGTHPVGGMPWPVPKELIAAGARVGPDPQRLTCQTCHTPHGAREEHLLVMGTSGSQLCLTCHTKLRPGFWRPDVGHEHPQNPPLSSDAQRQAIKNMGTKTGPGETLICLSCHKLHHGQAGRAMLADTLHDSQLCLRCHPGRTTMFGTKHDLRVTAPNERNRLGQSVEESGPCGACHSFHQFARRPDPQQLDPTGLCTTCHKQGQCAEKNTGDPFHHPTDVPEKYRNVILKLNLYSPEGEPEKKSLACLTCHDPHDTEHPHFLRAAPDQVCGSCHGDKLASLTAPHDFTTHPELKNGLDRTAEITGKCGFCHGVHKATGPALWVATKDPAQEFDGGCLECHRDGGLAPEKLPHEVHHPIGPKTAAKAAELECKLPLFDVKGHRTKDGFVACASCHDPHGGENGSNAMLRQTDADTGTTLCGQCHQEAISIQNSLHHPDLLREQFEDVRYCGPCHAVHAKPGMAPGDMWAAPLGPDSDTHAIRKCTGCHGPEGKATPITPTVHPPVAVQNVVACEMQGCLPLFNAKGEMDPQGWIACATCHLPHGPADSPALPLEGALTDDGLRGLRPMLREYLAPNLCTTCHGFDGMRRFLYYHDASKRTGSLSETK